MGEYEPFSVWFVTLLYRTYTLCYGRPGIFVFSKRLWLIRHSFSQAFDVFPVNTPVFITCIVDSFQDNWVGNLWGQTPRVNGLFYNYSKSKDCGSSCLGKVTPLPRLRRPPQAEAFKDFRRSLVISQQLYGLAEVNMGYFSISCTLQ